MLDDSAQSDAGPWVAMLRELVSAAGATRAVILLDRGEAVPLVIDVDADGTVEVAEGEETTSLGPSAFAGFEALAPLPAWRSFPPMEVDVEAGQVAGPLGALEFQGRTMRETASLLPGRSVLTVGWETADAETPMFIAARRGEPLVVALGEHQFELPEDPSSG